MTFTHIPAAMLPGMAAFLMPRFTPDKSAPV
mgnify:FL=1